ncbi:MAG: hypothetical protein OEW06_01565 [Gemmatimonadota bacterium]|nr:hypothetical protein [Gemmatimonadota bacterium]
MRAGLPLLLLVTSVAAAQKVPSTVLTKPDGQFPEPFSNVMGVRELPDGRVFVTDRLERTVSVLDFQTGDLTPVGREGQGPGEYVMPGPLFPFRGDSTLMVDFGAMRAVVLVGTQVGRTISLAGTSGLPLIPAAIDGQGRLYGSMPTMSRGAGPGAAADSVPIARLNTVTGAIDTAGWVGAGSGGGVVAMRVSGGGRMTTGLQPYAAQDAWAVAPDGRIAIVHADAYRVDWIDGSGRRTAGPALPHTPVKIGPAEKEEWADQMGGATMIMRTDGGASRAMRPERPNVDDLEWPAAKPPFETRGVLVTPEGELWIRVSQQAGAKRQRYDVVDGRGQLVRHVELADDQRLVGFGKGTLYTVRRDADDLQWLERYRR